MKTKIAMFLFAMSSIVVCLSGNAVAGEKVVVGKAVSQSQQVSMDQINHEAWNTLMRKYVNLQGEVDYRAWKASMGDHQSLDNYLNSLSKANRQATATKESQLAFWINAYNALTVKGILREYPTTSIRNHTARFIGYNIWKDLLLTVGDTQISLNDIEHEVLRKMGEPRIHFAIVCASRSCPRLLNAAYTTDQLEVQLNANTLDFFANPRNFQHDVSNRRFSLSSILNWFKDDFGADQASRLFGIAEYLPTPQAQAAAKNSSVQVSYLDYDWSLNEQRSSGSRPGAQQGSGQR